MNPRLELYRSGAPFLARHIYRGGGRRVAVLDRNRRARAALRAIMASGLPRLAAARRLRVSPAIAAIFCPDQF